MRSDPHRYSLTTLGRLALADETGSEDHSLVTRPRKLALLAWLAMRPGRRATRDQLLGIFWAERDEERARNSLSDAVSHLRRALGREAIRAQGNEIIIADELPLSVDALDVAAAAKAGDHAAVISAYRGAFLDGFYVSDAPGFDDWRDRVRARLEQAFVTSAAARCAELAGSERWDECREVADRWLESDPSSADAALMLLRAVDAPGTRESGIAALSTFDRIAKRIERDLELPIDRRLTRFAETVRERIATMPESLEPPPAAQRLAGSPRTPDTRPAVELPTSKPTARRTVKPPLKLFAVGVVAALVLAATLIISWRKPRVALDRHRVIVEPFRNSTGDTSLTRLGLVAADWISRGLSETHKVDVLDPTFESPRASQDPRVLGAIAHAGTVVTGAYVRSGDSITIDARIVNANDGTLVGTIEPVTAAVRDPLDGLQTVRIRVAAAMAVEFDSLLTSLGLGASHPPTYQAYVAWIDGLQQFVRRHLDVAAVEFARAAALDPRFVSARVWLGVTYGNIGQLERADSVLTSTVPERTSMAPLDRLVLDLWRARVRGDLATQYNVSNEMARQSPNSELARYLAAISAIDMNRFEQAVGLLRGIDVEHSAMAWDAWGLKLPRALHLLGRHPEELEEASRRLARDASQVPAMEERAIALAALNRPSEVMRQMDAVLALSRDSLNSAGAVVYRVGLELERHGHASEAHAMFGQAIAWARRRIADGAVRDTVRGLLMRSLYETGAFNEAKALSDSLMGTRSTDPAVLGMRGLVAAHLGRVDEAEHVSRMLSRLSPRYDWGEATFERARIAALLGHRDEAIDLLRQARGEGKPIIELHMASELLAMRGDPAFDALLAPR